LLGTFKQQIGTLTLVPSKGGCFELKIDGELVYSKLQTGRFPDETRMLDVVRAKLTGS
jgi:selenoprotein W-related protein